MAHMKALIRALNVVFIIDMPVALIVTPQGDKLMDRTLTLFGTSDKRVYITLHGSKIVYKLKKHIKSGVITPLLCTSEIDKKLAYAELKMLFNDIPELTNTCFTITDHILLSQEAN